MYLLLDYAQITNPGLDFEGGVSSCFTIVILTDIEFEGDEEFTVGIISPTGLDRIDIGPAARVVIRDYNGE